MTKMNVVQVIAGLLAMTALSGCMSPFSGGSAHEENSENIDELEVNVTALQEQVDSHLNRIGELQSEIENLTAQIELNNETARVEELLNKTAELQDEIADLISELNALQNTLLAQMQAEMGQLRDDLDDLKDFVESHHTSGSGSGDEEGEPQDPPEISFAENDVDKRLEVVSATPDDIQWNDVYMDHFGCSESNPPHLNSDGIDIAGGGPVGPSGSGAVTAGDYIQVYPESQDDCTFTLTHEPSSTNLGTWTFVQ